MSKVDHAQVAAIVERLADPELYVDAVDVAMDMLEALVRENEELRAELAASPTYTCACDDIGIPCICGGSGD